jgi:hypothetical protein
MKRKTIKDLIEASSLGTPDAQAIRMSATQEAVDAALRRADEIGHPPPIHPSDAAHDREGLCRPLPASVRCATR